MAVLNERKGEKEKAVENYERAIEIMEKALPAEHPDLKQIRRGYEEFVKGQESDNKRQGEQ
jgi:hypothetical protein